ncbi:hypothetical protein [Aquimarina sp. AU474]|uniref:hypothetical protein n=1 Tax=Aquimarina sp. AU474 TaxID=2108529 RepID=UPI000D69FCCE|nr:hypothetical protein [Aquimarina sp. AU474]
MAKLLHNLSLLAFLLAFTFGKAQTTTVNFNHVDHDHEINLSINDIPSFKSVDLKNNKEFSYGYLTEKSEYIHLYTDTDHDHKSDITLLDIITSDEGADFNCHGGFCMNELHFHKRGLSVKKQLFGYFMSISC